VSARDRHGPNFHYDVVVRVNSPVTAALSAEFNVTQQRWTDTGIVIDANATSVDVDLTRLSWLIGRKSVQLSVRAENSEGLATGELNSVTVDSASSTPASCIDLQISKTCLLIKGGPPVCFSFFYCRDLDLDLDPVTLICTNLTCTFGRFICMTK